LPQDIIESPFLIVTKEFEYLWGCRYQRVVLVVVVEILRYSKTGIGRIMTHSRASERSDATLTRDGRRKENC